MMREALLPHHITPPDCSGRGERAMRVITGSARGRKLLAPPGLDTRPTSDMTKEAVFSIVQFEVEGAAVLDLFAGSGQMGIEALSRGARSAVFIDTAKEARDIILTNLDKTGLREHARVSMTDAASFLAGSRDVFDIAFLDPPYRSDLLEALLPQVAERMHPAGVIICETERGAMLPETAGNFDLRREYRYGRAQVVTYRREEEPA